MDRVDLSALFLHSLVLWFVAVGGPSTILPDFHRYVVEAHQLMTSTEFAELYTPIIHYVSLTLRLTVAFGSLAWKSLARALQSSALR